VFIFVVLQFLTGKPFSKTKDTTLAPGVIYPFGTNHAGEVNMPEAEPIFPLFVLRALCGKALSRSLRESHICKARQPFHEDSR
jgi:hypothetical protein